MSIPPSTQNFPFRLARKHLLLIDHKQFCIALILTCLRSFILGALAQSKWKILVRSRYTHPFLVLLWVLLFSFELAANEKIEHSATVHIPMCDGTELTADLYYPPGADISNEFPCILLRLPGGRKAVPWIQLASLAKEGYVVAIQDTRSALDKEGKTVPYFSDGWDVHQDGFDTVNWLAASSFTNGKIGTIGFSAAGITQILLAPTAPPALKCQYIGQAPASLYHHAIYPGGRFQKNQVEIWFSYYAPHPSVLEVVKFHSIYNDFWQRVDSLLLSHQIEVPALHYGGWFDPFLQGTIDAFTARQLEGGKGAKGNQKLLIGPWNHYWPQDLSLGDFQVPENGRQAPMDVSAKRWFDYYLKGIENDVTEIPPVTYFVMGPFDGQPSTGNVWRHADNWPIPAVEIPLYLTADSGLSEKLGDEESSFPYESDPENPVATIGGRNLFLPSGPKDQHAKEEREDVLVFTTAPLEEDLEVTGRLVLKLYLESNVADIDVAACLTDVYPDGRSILIAEGLASLGVFDQQKGLRQEMIVDLWSTSLVFAKGHSIRISIAGSNYPKYEKNAQKVSAKSGDCRIFVGKKTPSCLLLPVVRKGTSWLAREKAS